MKHQHHDQEDAGSSPEARRFTMWALSTLGIEVRTDDGCLFQFEVPESQRIHFEFAERIFFATDRTRESTAKSNGDDPVEVLEPRAKLISRLSESLQEVGPWIHTVPEHQPVRLHALTPSLFEAFEVDQGTVRLAGCTLTDRPIARFTYRHSESSESSQNDLIHVFLDQDGSLLDAELTAALGLDSLISLKREPRRLSPDEAERLASLAGVEPAFDCKHWELLTTALVWCKYAEGKLACVVDDASAEVPFFGWAKLIANGFLKPTPFNCPATGLSTYHVAATDDGCIVSSDAIVVCEQSGQRTVANDLVTCPVTGRRAMVEFFTVCPASGKRLLSIALAPCPNCQQRVNPQVIRNGACVACRSLHTVRKEDPRMARLLDEYPPLDRWRRWKMHETSRVYILTAYGLMDRMLLVVDKHTLEPYRVAMAGRLFSVWADVSELQRDELLGR